METITKGCIVGVIGGITFGLTLQGISLVGITLGIGIGMLFGWAGAFCGAIWKTTKPEAGA